MNQRPVLTLALSFLSLTRALAQNDPGQTVGDTGTVSLYYGHGTLTMDSIVTLATVRAADGNIWLQQNIGASRVAQSAKDAAAFGDLFQWGRWMDDHQFRNSPTAPASSLTIIDPLGLGNGVPAFITGNHPNDWWGNGTPLDTWTHDSPSSLNGYDPCSRIGPSWRLATQAEWANLITLENITDTTSAFSSNLRLTAAGARDGSNGNVFNAGAYGSYWTSTASGVYAKSVAILDNSVNAADDAYRSYGQSLRCMSDTCTRPGKVLMILTNGILCPGNYLNLQAFLPVLNASGYVWSYPADWMGPASSTSPNVQVLMGEMSGNVRVRAFNACDTGDEQVYFVQVSPPLNPQITANGAVLTATAGFQTYQWYLNGQIIPFATQATYTATQNGNYTVRVSDGVCFDTSGPFSLTTLSVRGSGLELGLKIFPNPVADEVFVEAPVAIQVMVCSPEGKVLAERKGNGRIDLSGLPAGVYLLRVLSEEGAPLHSEKLLKAH